jgi:hypothetical protein
MRASRATHETRFKSEEKREAQRGFYGNTQALGRRDGVIHWGKICVEGVRLYTLPERPPLMLGAAITPQTLPNGWAVGPRVSSRSWDRRTIWGNINKHLGGDVLLGSGCGHIL